MTPINNGKVILAAHKEKIDQPREAPHPTELPQNIELPHFFPPPPPALFENPPPPPPLPLYKGGGRKL